MFKPKICGLYTRAVTDEEPAIVARIPYLETIIALLDLDEQMYWVKMGKVVKSIQALLVKNIAKKEMAKVSSFREHEVVGLTQMEWRTQ